MAAARVGDQTRLPSLEIGTEHGSMAGNCDSGYSCVYSSTMSWRSATQPLPKEVNPKLVFERLFEEVLDFVNVLSDETDELLETAVFFARDLAVKDVVEEELFHHRRDHDVDLASRQMHEHGFQASDLTRNVKLHARGILIRTMRQ